MSHMNNLNIESLFCGGSFERGGGVSNGGVHTNGKLDIETLFKKKDAPKFVFNSQLLLRTIYNKRKVLDKCYGDIYEKCCESIVSANNAGLTDIVYEVTEFVPECPEYSSEDCLLLIQEKMKEEMIPTLVMLPNKIFISWFNLEVDLGDRLPVFSEPYM